MSTRKEKEIKTITDVSSGPSRMTSLTSPQLADGLETTGMHSNEIFGEICGYSGMKIMSMSVGVRRCGQPFRQTSHP
jgi:hypothetical protein